MSLWILLLNALILGFRHGIDWDHIAAIADIVGTTTTNNVSARSGTANLTFTLIQGRAILLSALYAAGHSIVVLVLGLSAMFFAASLPKWIDPLMERIVGTTLILLGVWITYSLIQFAQGKSDFRIQSRWMVIFNVIENAFLWLRKKFTGHICHHKIIPAEYDPRAALAVGMIHGIGAETGTQVLLIAAIASSSNYNMGIGMLLAFTLGFAISNIIVAVVSVTGFISSTSMKPLYMATGVLTAFLSLIVGIYFSFGQGNLLPDLEKLWG